MQQIRDAEAPPAPPSLCVHVTEEGVRTRRGWRRCRIGDDVEFKTEHLETYCLAQWDPIVFDALLVAAAAEYADKTQHRPARAWPRSLELHIPVHDPDRWRENRVTGALHDALDLLTGDRWQVTFYERTQPLEPPRQGQFTIPDGSGAVIPFSDGLDSRCVAGLVGLEMRDRLIRVRLGSKTCDGKTLSRQRHPFTSVPYRVQPGRVAESSARSRGFKFALLSGLAAYLSGAGQIIVPESGQGALGPSLITVGQGYEDYRSHPLFTQLMERFLLALLGHRVRFSFPRLWHTKAETLRAFVNGCEDGSSWAGTWSCWQQTRQVSVDRKKRQCGVCAACMLRRMSIHAAGLTDTETGYVWENLRASTFEASAAPSFAKEKITPALRQYAIAGTLHLDHLAGLKDSPASARRLALSAFQLGRALGEPEADIRAKLNSLIDKHEREWRSFVHSLGSHAFLADWAVKGRSQ